jgi:TonB family protein
MNGLNYLLQSNLYLIIFYAFYWLLLRKETFNNYNRAYIVLSGVASFTIPLWNLDVIQAWFITQKTRDAITQMNIGEFVIAKGKSESDFQITDYLSVIYGFGCLILGAKLIMNIFNLYQFMYGIAPIKKAFSFFNNIFIAEGLDPDDVIYDHERVHASQYHSFDVLLFEVIGIICWFNPVIYLYKIAIKNIHEFIADEIASAKMPSKVEYAMLLFSEQFQTHPSVLVSNFFTKTSLKLRIQMLNKRRSNKIAVLKYGLIFPIFLGMLVITSVAIAKGKEISDMLTFNKNIEGTVLNYDYLPIVGATVVVANSNVGTTTDKNGKFILQTDHSNTELVFSHVSYLSKQLNVINAEPITITLKRQTKELQGAFVLAKQDGIDDFELKSDVFDSPKSAEIDLINDDKIIEKNAEYIGGTSELYNFLERHLRYPAEAKANRKQGIVYTKFMVNEKGEISNVKIVNPLGYMGFIGFGLETEAKRVVSNMPKWLPAIQNGEPVSSDFTLPIQFILDGKIQEKQSEGKTYIMDTKKNISVDPSLFIINGKETSKKEFENIEPNQIESMSVLNGENATKKYGDKGKEGVVEIITNDKTTISDFEKIKENDEIFNVVEKQAEFPGGTTSLGNYLAKNLKYPMPAQRAMVEGKVFVSFVINKTGEISDVQILKGLGFGLDAEAIRLIQNMPKWTPAKQSGREVNSRFNIPIMFELKNIK